MLLEALVLLSLLSCFALSAPTSRYLPPGPLNMGYAGGPCEGMVDAAKSGLNVIFWFAINLSVDSSGQPVVTSGPDLDCVANVSATLRAMQLPTTHMITVGGWDAPHPDTSNPPAAMYAAWKQWNEHVAARRGFENGFDGVDWDLEGNDDVTSVFNTFSVACLELVGEFSMLAKRDGYIVSMVPAESYFDPTTSSYDRSLLHPYPEWHPECYHGHNAYAYVLSRYGITAVTSTGSFRSSIHVSSI